MADAASGARPKIISAPTIIAVCFAIAALEGYDIQAVGVAAPSMAPALHLADQQIGQAGSWAMVGLVIGSLIGGWGADRFGRKIVLVGSVVWFGVFSILTASAHTAEMLMISRLLTGLGFGGAMPNMIAVASEISPPGRRGATVTTMFVGMPAGGALAALIARYLPHGFDWRMIYLIGGALPLVLTPVAQWLLPETRPIPAPNADRRILFALFGGGRAVSTILMWIAYAFTLVVLYLMLGWLPILVIAKGLSKEVASLAAFSFNGVGILGGIALGLLVDRFRFRWPLGLTYLGLIASMALLAVAHTAPQVMILSALVGFGVIGAQYSLYALAPLYYATPVRGVGSGAAVGAGRIGSIVGPLLAGALRQQHASAGQVLAYTLPVIFVAGLAAMLLVSLGKPYQAEGDHAA